jgi:hypothetical protein
LQIRCKSHSNPIPEWENEGRQRAVTTIFVEEKKCGCLVVSENIYTFAGKKDI